MNLTEQQTKSIMRTAIEYAEAQRSGCCNESMASDEGPRAVDFIRRHPRTFFPTKAHDERECLVRDIACPCSCELGCACAFCGCGDPEPRQRLPIYGEREVEALVRALSDSWRFGHFLCRQTEANGLTEVPIRQPVPPSGAAATRRH